MNTTTKITTILLTALALAGCRDDRSPITRTTPQPIRQVASHGSMTVYIMTIDGSDYVVARCPYGVALCPK